MPPRPNTTDQWLPGAIFGGIGLIISVVGWVLVLQQAAFLERATAVDGLVLESYVETATSVKGPDSHVARVRYRYLVGDATWENDRVFPHDIRTSSRRAMRRVAQRFPEGAFVKVWVDPEDPEASFLLKEMLWLPYVFALAPMIFVLIGAIVALPSWAVPLPMALLLGPLWWHQQALPETIPGWMQAAYLGLLTVAFVPMAWKRGRRRLLSSLCLVLVPTISLPKVSVQPPANISLFEFDRDADVAWTVMNDGVMGGRSAGFVAVADGSLRFTGTLVTQGGGFTSVRARRDADLGGMTGIELRVRGSGRQFEVEVDDGYRTYGRNVSRRAPFPTSTEWTVVRIPFTALRSTIFGQRVDAPAINAARIRGLGIFLADGKDGAFRLDVDYIRAYAD